MDDTPSNNVIRLVVGPVGDGYHVEADTVLEGAKGLLTNVVVVGWDKDRSVYFAGSDGVAETNLLLDLAKQAVLASLDED